MCDVWVVSKSAPKWKLIIQGPRSRLGIAPTDNVSGSIRIEEFTRPIITQAAGCPPSHRSGACHVVAKHDQVGGRQIAVCVQVGALLIDVWCGLIGTILEVEPFVNVVSVYLVVLLKVDRRQVGNNRNSDIVSATVNKATGTANHDVRIRVMRT